MKRTDTSIDEGGEVLADEGAVFVLGHGFDLVVEEIGAGAVDGVDAVLELAEVVGSQDVRKGAGIRV